MARVIPTKRSLLVRFVRARTVWPDLRKTMEFQVTLWIFLMIFVGFVLLDLASRGQ
jgi:hypothetical protein